VRRLRAAADVKTVADSPIILLIVALCAVSLSHLSFITYISCRRSQLVDGTIERKVKLKNLRMTKTGNRTIESESKETYDSKRDAYHGYDQEAHLKKTEKIYQEREQLRREKRTTREKRENSIIFPIRIRILTIPTSRRMSLCSGIRMTKSSPVVWRGRVVSVVRK
jgi:hypothetical protein